MKKNSFIKTVACVSVITMSLAASLFSQKPLPKQFFPAEGDASIHLRNWFIQSSIKVKAGGEQISQSGLSLEKWYPAIVPSTVLGVLVQNNRFGDIYFSDNLKSIPADEFQVSWWYRTEFPLPADPSVTAYKAEFDGINYRANIWLNGKQIASSSDVFGPFRRHEFDITAKAKRGENNILAVEVFPPLSGEPALGFADWNPAPPDKSMGLWREVRIKSTGDVSIHDPFVMTRLNPETLGEARLTVSAELKNNSTKIVSGKLEGQIESLKFSQDVSLEPKETKKIIFTPESHPVLILKNPRIWWTHDLGRPELYVLSLVFLAKDAEKGPPKTEEGASDSRKKDDGVGRSSRREFFGGRLPEKGGLRGSLSDLKLVRFGIREVAGEIDDQGHRVFKLNGKKIFIRGAGWTDDLFLDNTRKKTATQIAYAKHLNLNALRLEGFWGTNKDIYDLCDENGLLILAGWSCQWEWPNGFGKPTDQYFGGIVDAENIRLIARSWRDQVRWLRNHPSLLAWLEASDLRPKPELEEEYDRILKEDDPTRPVLISAKNQTGSVTGPSGVKMNGPYDWVPPNYWFTDAKNGGAFGFSTETGIGPQIPSIESLRKTFLEKDLWPINEMWAFHSGRDKFNNFDRFTAAMTERLGAPKDLHDFLSKAHYLNYESARSMFEAYIGNKGRATGVIFWMLNSAWPKLWWQLYDYFLMPTGGFYGIRKAGSPLHLICNLETREIIAANNTLKAETGLKASLSLYDLGLNRKYFKEMSFGLAADEVKIIDRLPEFDSSSAIWFADLRLKSSDGSTIDQNFYCLPVHPDVLDDASSTWYVTPVKRFADLTALQDLPPVRIKEKHSIKKDGAERIITVELENSTPHLALLTELNVYRSDSNDVVLPVFWEDNFVTLLPGEKRKIRGFFAVDDLAGAEPVIRIRGWNIR